MYFIGIDIGTSSICGILFDLSNCNVEVLTKENNTAVKSNNPWEKLQDPEAIYRIVKGIIDEFFKRNIKIHGIGLAGQMHGILYVNKTGKCLSPLIIWQDGRGNQPFRDNLSYSAWLARSSGYKVASGFGLVSHFYNLENNSIPPSSETLCTIMDYVAMRLTNTMSPIINVTNASSLGFFDLARMQFDLDIVDRFMEPKILPTVTNSFQAVGEYNKIPVYPGIGDNQAGFLGSVNNPEKSLLINVGTSGQLSIYSKHYFNTDFLDVRPFPGGGYLYVGASLCGGVSLNILKTFFDKTIELFSKSPSDSDFFKLANSIDPLVQNSDPLQIKTLFAGTRTDPMVRGSIINISMVNFTPHNLIVGFYEGVSNELYDFYCSIPDSIPRNNFEIIGSGNAIRRNKLLRKTIETKFDRTLRVPCHNEEAAFGACLCSVIGGGYVKSVMDAGKLINYKVRDEEFIEI